jgi:CheY-like chemotaxis protein
VTLAVKSVQPVSLVFHELATNAVKHGALSVSRGTVSICWEVDRDGSLVLRWTESGGPRVVEPKQQGFGSLLIEMLSEQMHSQGVRSWRPEGLNFTIHLPEAAFKLRSAPIDVPPTEIVPESETIAGRKVLIVEDEAIVALLLSTGLKNDGWEIIGPASNLEAAYKLLADGAVPDAAVLDINLDGTPIYPLARVLQARNVPFLFFSGYSAPILEPNFKDVKLIGKPTRVHIVCEELAHLLSKSQLIA